MMAGTSTMKSLAVTVIQQFALSLEVPSKTGDGTAIERKYVSAGEDGIPRIRTTKTLTDGEFFELVLVSRFFAIRTVSSPHLYLSAHSGLKAPLVFSEFMAESELFVLERPNSDEGEIVSFRSLKPVIGYMTYDSSGLLTLEKEASQFSSFYFETRISHLEHKQHDRERTQGFGRESSVASTVTDSLLQSHSSHEMTLKMDDSTPLVMDNVEQRRQKRIEEFIQNEEQYLKSLNLINEKFIDHLSADLTVSEIEELFGNVQALIDLSTSFVSDLHVRKQKHEDGVRLFGDLITKRTLDLEGVYNDYQKKRTETSDAMQAKVTREPGFAKTMKELEAGAGMKLATLLDRPMKRLQEYSSLIGPIQLSTRLDHPDYFLITEAHEDCERISGGISRQSKEAEKTIQLEGFRNCVIFSPSCPKPEWFTWENRQLLIHGELMRYPRAQYQRKSFSRTLKKTLGLASPSRVICILLDSALLVTEKEKKMERLAVQDIIPIHPELMMMDEQSYDDEQFQLMLKNKDQDIYLFKADSMMLKKQWADLIRSAQDVLMKQRVKLVNNDPSILF